MRIAGLSTSEPLTSWASRARTESTVVSDLEAEAKVLVRTAHLIHAGPEENRRPSLKLAGELRGIFPSQPLPYNIQEVYFRDGHGPKIDGIYTFDQDQLVTLVEKGYFTKGFDAPAEISDIVYELPVTVDALILPPRDQEDVPVVFLEVQDRSTLALNHPSTGYDLTVYFPNVLQDEEEFEAEAETRPEVERTQGKINDMFADRDLEQEVASEREQVIYAEQEPEVEDDSDFRRLADERRRELEQELADDETRARESDPVEAFYRERVEPVLDDDGQQVPQDGAEHSEQGHENPEQHQEDEEQHEDLFGDLDPSDDSTIITPRGVTVEDEGDLRRNQRRVRDHQQGAEIRQRPDHGRHSRGSEHEGLGE